jgi:hypothetical protein
VGAFQNKGIGQLCEVDVIEPVVDAIRVDEFVLVSGFLDVCAGPDPSGCPNDQGVIRIDVETEILKFLRVTHRILKIQFPMGDVSILEFDVKGGRQGLDDRSKRAHESPLQFVFLEAWIKHFDKNYYN